jgi:hypothetical protein
MRLALLAVGLLAAWAGGCGTGERTFTVRAPEAGTPAPSAPLAPPVARVLHLGDFGEGSRQQSAVAAGMAASHARLPFDLAFAAGDNLYECGPDVGLAGADACAFGPDGATVVPGFVPPADDRFARQHERPLAALGPLPVHMALGNHDVATWPGCTPGGDPARIARLKACLEVAHRAERWSLPARHHTVDLGRARFVVVDSNVVAADYGGFTLDGEVAFVAEAASEAHCPPERACFLVGHHPPATAGSHADDWTPEGQARADRLVAAAGGRIRAWLAGHDHDLQHLRTPGGLDVFVSGNGARDRPGERFERTVPAGARLLFGSVRWGHGVLEVGGDGWRYRFEGHDGGALYCCAAAGTGSCRPAACPP